MLFRSIEVTTAAHNVFADLTPEWLSLAETAIAAAGFIVDFLPLLTLSATPLPPDRVPEAVRTRLIGLKAILIALLENGPLSEHEFDVFCDRLGAVGNEAGIGAPKPGDALYFAGTSIETLAAIGILPTVAERFRVYVTKQELGRISDFLAYSKERAELAD